MSTEKSPSPKTSVSDALQARRGDLLAADEPARGLDRAASTRICPCGRPALALELARAAASRSRSVSAVSTFGTMMHVEVARQTTASTSSSSSPVSIAVDAHDDDGGRRVGRERRARRSPGRRPSPRRRRRPRGRGRSRRRRSSPTFSSFRAWLPGANSSERSGCSSQSTGGRVPGSRRRVYILFLWPERALRSTCLRAT